jgi:hypothetical protein
MSLCLRRKGGPPLSFEGRLACVDPEFGRLVLLRTGERGWDHYTRPLQCSLVVLGPDKPVFVPLPDLPKSADLPKNVCMEFGAEGKSLLARIMDPDDLWERTTLPEIASNKK